MSALERVPDYNPNPFDAAATATAVVRTSDQFERMASWLDLFMRTAEVAKVLSRTAFVPDAMRGQPEDIAAAMMRSLELGIDPLDGLANLHVIKGKVGYSAEFMRRRILEAGHEFEFVESTDDRCKIRGRRNATGEWQTVVFTADQARKAKINLGDYPSDKLVARASSRLCRRVFPDVLAGATIIEDVIDVDGEELKPIESATAPVQRKRQPRATKVKAASAPTPKPAADDVDELLDDNGDEAQTAAQQLEQSPDTDSEGVPDGPASAAQNRKMHAMFRDAGLSDRDDRLTVCGHILGFQIDTSPGLTVAEASKLIDTLDRWEQTGTTDDQVREILNSAALAAESSTAATEQEQPES